MAVLLRSVKANAEPITRALQAAGIPFVVTGMTNLFGTAEAEAARQLFYFIADRPGWTQAAVEGAWEAAHLGIDPAALDQRDRGRRRREGRADRSRPEALGPVLDPARLPDLPRGGRRPRGAGPGRPRRGRLLQPRQVQPGHLGLRDDPLPLQAGREVRLVRRLPPVPRRGRLPRGLAGQPVRQPRRRADHDHPPGQGDAVAGGVRARAAPEPLPGGTKSAAATSGTCCPAPASRGRRASRARSRTSGGSSTWP